MGVSPNELKWRTKKFPSLLFCLLEETIRCLFFQTLYEFRQDSFNIKYKTMDNLPARVLLSLAILKPIPYLLDAIEIKQFLRQFRLKRCRSTYVVFFKWQILNATLRGSRKLVIPYVNTTTYSLHSSRYTSANIWNKLTEDLRSITSLNEFRTKICQISFEHQCNCNICR